MFDTAKCREHAAEFLKRAEEATDPIEKQRLADTAYGWASLADDLANLEEKLNRQRHAVA